MGNEYLDIVQISAGGEHTCAITAAGAAKCWGSGDRGRLGNNSNLSSSVPIGVVGLSSGVASISAGGYHTCAVTTAGAAKCWGYNASGQLGNNSTAHSLVPMDVVGLSSGVASISAGAEHTCAVTTSGAAKCWGSGGSGQLGNNSTTNSLVPVDVVGLGSSVASISAGAALTCAVTTAGAAKCWGSGRDGKLGHNTTTNSSLPVDVVGLSSGVVSISVDSSRTCAVTTAGAAKCWGANNYGQLGDNSTSNRLVPVDVLGLSSGVTNISAGAVHTCAATTFGAAKCWGHGANGKLGYNSTANSPVPVDLLGD
ncbi:RCC1 domain-containing protein [Alcaligenes faecalis]|uniref:RCC1 domain-containing protein n=1 Tax=Alcaligenes faecalis TaxID=511 RepID=UPI003F8CFA7A